MQSDVIFRTAKGWDSFSDKYARRIQKNTSVFFMTLLNMLHYEEANSILDAGCGAGYLHQHMLNQKKPEAHLYGFDLSSEMVRRAGARMKRSLNKEQIGSLDILTHEEVDSVKFDDEIFKKINYHLSVGSVEDLSQYNNEIFDIYVCNLVYQIIGDQPKAMSEAFRVLKPGGKVGITVWGKKENCSALWFLKELAFETGLAPAGMQGGRFVSDPEELITLATNAGFINPICWSQMTPFDVVSMKNVEEFFNPEIEGILANSTKEQIDIYYKALEKMINDYKREKKPFPFECYLLVAEKPM
ncbi:unnamed protein product (macronuclear) [Paramecium tetraurelia]|uniref:Methyltransferase type 11 domain-containing protein n=1 Tax=Paramecium tetraurelia TaxID=5888 RepID=A0EC01_PARTE|nr:uncharacterized protein GSPATT00025554001 [Paramecium tetraurelia]CAK92818.1 unnamed protein product [Paramecium tetraurelia]|eukprot:XP_001460215.1 hypothetical protein (macronuclear) [Paramecium tetraurelia strain d4-2]